MRLLFWLYKSRINKSGEVPVFVRITIDGIREQFSTGVFITPKNWNSTKQRCKGRTATSNAINTSLNQIESDIRQVYNEMSEVFNNVSARDVRMNYLQEQNPKKGLIEVFEEHLNKMADLVGGEYSEETLKLYDRTKRNVQVFIRQKFKQSDVRLDRLKTSFAEDYVHFLRVSKGHGNNTINKHLQRLNRVVNKAVLYDYITKNPLLPVKVSRERKEITYLTMEEVKRIEQKNFGIHRLEVIRDLYLFQIYTGLSYVDLRNLTHEHLRLGVEGNNWIISSRQKTGQPFRVPLLPQAEAILTKYKELTLDKSKKLLPVPSNQKLNSYLKEIGDLCGIKLPLSSHLARRTFCTTIALSHGMPLESVAAIVGHSSTKVTEAVYAKVLDFKLSKDMSDLKLKLGS